MVRVKSTETHKGKDAALTIQEKIKKIGARNQVAEKRKPVRFRNITLALRQMVKAQRATGFCMLKAPFKTLFRQTAATFKIDTWVTPLAFKYVQQLVEARSMEVFKEAMKRRVDQLTPGEKKQQIAVTLNSVHICGAYHTETKYLKSDFASEFGRALIDVKNDELSAH